MEDPTILLINGRLLQGTYKGKKICHYMAVKKEDYSFSSVSVEGEDGFNPDRMESMLLILEKLET